MAAPDRATQTASPAGAPSAEPAPAIAPVRPPARRKPRASGRRATLGWQVAILVAIIAGMQLLNITSGNLVMPSPVDVVRESIIMWSDGTMLRALGQSLTVLGLGFILAASTGIGIGILFGGFPRIGRVFDPFVNAINATPGAAFIPLVIVWFGLYTEAKVVVVWNAAVFPILINTTGGIANANKDLIEMAQSFGAARRQLFWQVMVPDAMPSILSGLRIGAAVCIVGTVIAELTMAQSGLGGEMIKAGNRFQMDRYFAVVIVMMALGSLITIALRLAERRFGRWRLSL
ncbi:ABC transporter permease [Pseudoroseicyclus tamaricis]|uniref:ABC transporter permease n=1 Tax=Pseudoroseicyclus tamaricis TaxID=2705421 RepID=A0A6B2JPY6_9RHOB|nr:ABC transporter permease [Pseudoroseicyclus tamaricis]NDV00080.1 ABC transporter permease [Pseudoroseicyclus tamaricis]